MLQIWVSPLLAVIPSAARGLKLHHVCDVDASRWEPPQGIDAGRRQYAEILADLGFAPPGYGALRARERSAELDSLVAHEVDEYSGNARVVKSALVAGFYPQVGSWDG